MTYRMGRSQFTIAISGLLIAQTALFAADAAYAQTAPAAPQSKFAPLKTPSLDSDALKPPPGAADASLARPKLEESGKEPPPLKLPTQVDLGKFDLQFKAGQTSDVTSRTGFDSGETSNLSKIRPGKSESVTPNYFGLKLTAPTH